MKKVILFLIIAIYSACLSGCQPSTYEFPEITETELQECLQSKNDSVIFCTQDLCSGCAPVKESLIEIAETNNIDIRIFNVETESSKRLLIQYGLDQVPAIIKISNGEINLYKGVLTKENIERLLSTDHIQYDRISDITEISYTEFLQKANSNIDFFVYFFRDTCSDCQDFSKILNEYLHNNPNAGLYAVDISDIKSSLSEEGYNEFLDNYLIHWVPHILHMKNGVKLSSYEYPALEYRESEDGDNPNSEAANDFHDWINRELQF